MRIIRTIFQDSEPGKESGQPQFVLVLDMEAEINLSTRDISDIVEKMQAAFPGIFPCEDSLIAHNCGGGNTGVDEHSFKEEIDRGTNIAHLLEHVLLYLLSKRSCACSAFCGQRSIDLAKGIDTHYYLVMDCPSKIEAIVASELGLYLVNSWIKGEAAIIDAAAVFTGIHEMIGPMVNHTAT